MKIERCLIDANWGTSTDVGYQFCRQSPHAAILLPSHGRFVGASSLPMSEYQQRPGDRMGLNWRIPTVMGKRRREAETIVGGKSDWQSVGLGFPNPSGL